MLAFSLNAVKIQKTHLKQEKAVVRLTLQIDSIRNLSYKAHINVYH